MRLHYLVPTMLGVSGNTLSFVTFGARVAVRGSREFLEALLPEVPPQSRPCSKTADLEYEIRERSDNRFTVTRNGSEVITEAPSDDWVSQLASDIEFNIAIHARRVLFVHAGAVVVQGRAIVMPGHTFSGKSTMVRAFLDAGATYYSDEFAIVGGDGRIRAFPRRLSLRTTDGRSAERRSASSLGATVGKVPVPLALVLTTRFDAARPPILTEQSRADILLSLFANTVVAQLRPQFALNRLKRAVGDARGFGGVRGEAAETVDWAMKIVQEV